MLSKKLATIHTSVPIECRLDDLTPASPDDKALRALYEELEFSIFLKQLEGMNRRGSEGGLRRS